MPEAVEGGDGDDQQQQQADLGFFHADGLVEVAVGSFQAPFDETFGGFVGGVVGAWLGAVPIPLDWDREWQKWPVTILCGVYGGYLVVRLLGGTVLFGKRF